MRARKLGDDVRVMVSEREVAEFKRRWACSGLPDTGMGFTFDKKGDLVDISPDGVDGEACLALSNDAQAYAQRRFPAPA